MIVEGIGAPRLNSLHDHIGCPSQDPQDAQKSGLCDVLSVYRFQVGSRVPLKRSFSKCVPASTGIRTKPPGHLLTPA